MLDRESYEGCEDEDSDEMFQQRTNLTGEIQGQGEGDSGDREKIWAFKSHQIKKKRWGEQDMSKRFISNLKYMRCPSAWIPASQK